MPEWPNLSHGCWDWKDHVVSVPNFRRNVFSGRLRREDRWHPSRGGSGAVHFLVARGTGHRPARRPSRASLRPPRARTSWATLRLAAASARRPSAPTGGSSPRSTQHILAAAQSVTRSDCFVGGAIGGRDRRSGRSTGRPGFDRRAIPGIGLSAPKTTVPFEPDGGLLEVPSSGRSSLPVRAVKDFERVDQARHRGTTPTPVVPQDRLGDPSPSTEPNHADHRELLPEPRAIAPSLCIPAAARSHGGGVRLSDVAPPLSYGSSGRKRRGACKTWTC